MYVIDTETTGLYFQHKATTFAIGCIDSTGGYKVSLQPIDPYTRQRTQPYPYKFKQQIREAISSEEGVAFQNAFFDIKALCESNILDWEEPYEASWWNNVIEMGHLIHLHNSTDAQYGGRLKILAPKYLNKTYESQDELQRITDRCRTFCRNRTDWVTANETSTPQYTKSFNCMDYWLPAALYEQYPDQQELSAYMGADYNLLPIILPPYLYDDCQVTLDLVAGLFTSLQEEFTLEEIQRFTSMNTQLSHVLWKSELNGVNIRTSELDNAIDVCEYWIKDTHNKCQEITGIECEKFTNNIVRNLIYDTYKVPPFNFTAKAKQPAVDIETLIEIKETTDNPDLSRFLTQFIGFSKYTKKHQALTGYRRTLCKGSETPYKIHNPQSGIYLFSNLKPHGTGTTRFSSNNPNQQNIEKGSNPFADVHEDIAELLKQAPLTRSVFGPPRGYWWLPIDYAQLQLRIFAYATKDPALIKAFEDGHDFHDFMTRIIFDIPDSQEPTASQRRIGKNVNFGFIFGASEGKIDAVSHRPGMYQYLMECFPHAQEFLESTLENIYQTGTVYTMGGYPLRIPKEYNKGKYDYAAHKGVNYIIQGTEGEIVKKAIRLTDDYLVEHNLDARMAMQIHDEIVFQIPRRFPKRHIKQLCNLMEDAGTFHGVVTPVEPELCTQSLTQKRELIL